MFICPRDFPARYPLDAAVQPEGPIQRPAPPEPEATSGRCPPNQKRIRQKDNRRAGALCNGVPGEMTRHTDGQTIADRTPQPMLERQPNDNQRNEHRVRQKPPVPRHSQPQNVPVRYGVVRKLPEPVSPRPRTVNVPRQKKTAHWTPSAAPARTLPVTAVRARGLRPHVRRRLLTLAPAVVMRSPSVSSPAQKKPHAHARPASACCSPFQK